MAQVPPQELHILSSVTSPYGGSAPTTSLVSTNTGVGGSVAARFGPQSGQIQLREQLTEGEQEIYDKIFGRDDIGFMANAVYSGEFDYNKLTPDMIQRILAQQDTSLEKTDQVLKFLEYGLEAMDAAEQLGAQEWVENATASAREMLLKSSGYKSHKQDSFLLAPDGTISTVQGGKVYELKQISSAVNAGAMMKTFTAKTFHGIWNANTVEMPPLDNLPVLESNYETRDGSVIEGAWWPKWAIYQAGIVPTDVIETTKFDFDIAISAEPVPLESYHSIRERMNTAAPIPKYDSGEVDPALPPVQVAFARFGREDRLAFNRRQYKGYRMSNLSMQKFFISSTSDSERPSLNNQPVRTSKVNMYSTVDDITNQPIILDKNQLYVTSAMNIETDVMAPHEFVYMSNVSVMCAPVYVFEPSTQPLLDQLYRILKLGKFRGEPLNSNVSRGPSLPFDNDYVIAQPVPFRSVPEMTATIVSDDDAAEALREHPIAMSGDNRFGSLRLITEEVANGCASAFDKVSYDDFRQDCRAIFKQYLPFVGREDSPIVGYYKHPDLAGLDFQGADNMKAQWDGLIWNEDFQTRFPDEDCLWSIHKKLDWIFDGALTKNPHSNTPLRDRYWNPVAESEFDLSEPETPFLRFWGDTCSGNYRLLIEHIDEAMRWICSYYKTCMDRAEITRTPEQKNLRHTNRCPMNIFTDLLGPMDRTKDQYNPFDMYTKVSAGSPPNNEQVYENMKQRRLKALYIFLQIFFEIELLMFFLESSEGRTDLSPDDRTNLENFGDSQEWYFQLLNQKLKMSELMKCLYMPDVTGLSQQIPDGSDTVIAGHFVYPRPQCLYTNSISIDGNYTTSTRVNLVFSAYGKNPTACGVQDMLFGTPHSVFLIFRQLMKANKATLYQGGGNSLGMFLTKFLKKKADGSWRTPPINYVLDQHLIATVKRASSSASPSEAAYISSELISDQECMNSNIGFIALPGLNHLFGVSLFDSTNQDGGTSVIEGNGYTMIRDDLVNGRILGGSMPFARMNLTATKQFKFIPTPIGVDNADANGPDTTKDPWKVDRKLAEPILIEHQGEVINWWDITKWNIHRPTTTNQPGGTGRDLALQDMYFMASNATPRGLVFPMNFNSDTDTTIAPVCTTGASRIY